MNKLILSLFLLFSFQIIFAQIEDNPCTAPLQPINDDCTINSTRFETDNATSTFSSNFFPNCSISGDDDIFIPFIAPSTGEALIYMTDYATPNIFTRADFTINLMEGSDCNNLNIANTETYISSEQTVPDDVDCIDMSSGILNDVNHSPIVFENLTAAQSYYIRLSEQDDQNAWLDLSFYAVIENDYCSNALELTGASNFEACNYGATDRDEPDENAWTALAHSGTFGGGTIQQCSSWSSNENMVWYYFTVNDNTPQPISITAENVQCQGGAGTLQLGVWYQGNATTCDIDNMQGVGCAVGTNVDLTVTLPPDVPNGTYYVAMDGNAGALCSWEFTSDQILPVCPSAPSASASAISICSGGNLDLDLAFSVAGFGPVTGEFNLSVTPSAGVIFSSGPNAVLEGTETIIFPSNQTCAPIEYTIQIDAVCRGADNTTSDITDDPANITITVYPEALSVVVVDDGSTCGTPKVELQAANATPCESQSGIGNGTTASGSCGDDGETLIYDFSATSTVIALGTPPAGCSLPSLTGTITCSGCANCSIDNIVVGPQRPCDTNTGTYEQDIIVSYTDAPNTGNLDVNGTVIPITSSPQTVTLTGLIADGNPVSVIVSFTADATCTLSASDLFTAPPTCVSCDDGIQNGGETGLDCGGPSCPACPPCTVSQYYSGSVLPGVYQTSNSIGANILVFSGTSVTFLASCIDLDETGAGFEVQLGAEFLAAPVPCTGFSEGDGTNALQEVVTNTTVSNEGQILLNYYLPKDSPTKLTIQSLDASVEYDLFDTASKQKGEHMVQITLNTLESGVYLLILTTKEEQKVERIVVP